MSFFDDAIGSLGKSLAKSATSYLTETTGLDVGGTLAFLFGEGQTSKGKTLTDLTANIATEFSGSPDGLALLQNDLNAQAVAIGAIGTQLTEMASAIRSIAGEIQGIEALLEEIQQKQLYLSWQQQDNQIKTYVVRIDSAFTQYSHLVHLSATAQNVTEWARSVLDANLGERNASMSINGYMLTDQQNKGALQLWADMVCPLIEKGKLDYRQAIDQYLAYYTKLTWAQLRATNMVMEAYHFQPNNNALAQQAWADYKALILSQEDEFIENTVRIVMAGLIGSTLKHIDLTAYEAAAQFHPDVRTTTRVYYEESAVFKRAEELLARLALTDPDDRRVVVHLTYFGDAFKTAIDSATIALRLSVNGKPIGDPLNPSRSAEFGPMNTPSPATPTVDKNWITNRTFYVKRLIYAGSQANLLGSGQYQLNNLNGVLPAIDTYMGAKTTFQTDAVLANLMQVSENQPFDFMNFAGYFASSM